MLWKLLHDVTSRPSVTSPLFPNPFKHDWLIFSLFMSQTKEPCAKIKPTTRTISANLNKHEDTRLFLSSFVNNNDVPASFVIELELIL